jgi:hypothetical protein
MAFQRDQPKQLLIATATACPDTKENKPLDFSSLALFLHCINKSLTLKCTLNRLRWYELKLAWLRTGFIDWIFVLVTKFYITWNHLVGCIWDSHGSDYEECSLLAVILYTSWLGHWLLNTFHDKHDNFFIKVLALLDDWFSFQSLLEPHRITIKMFSLPQPMLCYCLQATVTYLCLFSIWIPDQWTVSYCQAKGKQV